MGYGTSMTRYLPAIAFLMGFIPFASATFCHNDPVNNVDPLGDRAYGNDFGGPVQAPWDWIEREYTQAEVDLVYLHLRSRDRHIYNPGLANYTEYRESNKETLERALGLPVVMIENATLVEPGYQLSKLGRKIGRQKWTFNPMNLTRNVVGRALETAGKPIQIAGAVLDFPVAGVGKLVDWDPAIRQTHREVENALKYVDLMGDEKSRVYMWMHSEGAIHGRQILNTMAADRTRLEDLRKIQCYTFGAGTLAFNPKINARHFGTLNDVGNRDPVLEFAAAAVGKRADQVEWKQVNLGYTHGFPTYAETFMVDLSKLYFRRNALSLLRR